MSLFAVVIGIKRILLQSLMQQETARAVDALLKRSK
jgi:hypothetical protein